MNRIRSLVKRTGIIALVAVLILCAAIRPAYAEVPGKYDTVTDLLGITRADIIDWLSSHEEDDYYLGTPYGYRAGETINNKVVPFNYYYLGRSWGIWPNGYAFYPYTYSPNGDVVKGGVPQMNCGGFVHHVLTHASNKDGTENKAVKDRLFALERMFDVTGMGYVGACSLYLAMYAAGVRTHHYSTIQETLESGILEKGDIIILDGTGYYGQTYDIFHNFRDWHVGFFWGDSSDDNVFWHSTHETMGLDTVTLLDGRVLENPANLDEIIAGRLNDPEDENETVLYGNVISEIVPPSQCEGVIVLKFGDLDAGWHESKTGLRTYVDAATGCTLNGWQIIDKELYYFEDTVMCTGWKQINGKWYFFDEDGSYTRQDYYQDGKHEETPTAGDSSTDSYTVETGWITRFRALLKRMAQNIINGL